MNTLIRRSATLALLVLLMLVPFNALAQTVDGQFQTQINPGAGTAGADQLEVTLELAALSSFDLGSATLMFTYNDAALALPSAPAVNDALAASEYQFQDPYIFNSGEAKFYNSSTVTVFGEQGRLSANLVLDVANLGQPLPEAFTPVVTVFFDITDPAQTAELAWITSGDANPTEVFLEDNATQVALGEFSGSNTLLPVELVSFEAVRDGSAVELVWQTASEVNNAGFEVEHREVAAGNDGAELSHWSRVGFVDGYGTTLETQRYSYRMTDLAAGTHVFRLKQVDYDGTFEYSPEVEVSMGVVGDYVVSAAYPNPFNPSTQFTLAVAQAQMLEITVYDVLGRRVAVLFDGEMAANRSRVFEWEAGDRPSGLYMIRVQGERFVETRRVTLLK